MKKLNSILRFCLIASLLFVIFCLIYSYRLVSNLDSSVITQEDSFQSERSQETAGKTEEVTNTLVTNHDLLINKDFESLPDDNQEVSDIDFLEELDLFEPLDGEVLDPIDEEVRISPFGFGPYPEIPEGFPFDNPWDVPTTNATFELMHRVQIKLWNEGKRPEGMTWEKGRVYPIYPNTIYVEWDYFDAEDGSMERYISEVTAGTLSPEADALLDEGIIPPGVTVYKYSEAGIDPYSYLGLQ